MQARDWLSQRDYLDLDAQAERALRAAGAAFQNDVVAERWLDEAAALAADHPAVLLAHYRYYLYKHRYEEAEHFARRCLAQVARELGLPSTLLDTCASDADFSATEPRVRYWLFGMQALGYVVLRCGRLAEARALLRKVVELDSTDQTKTRVLWNVIDNAGREETGGNGASQ